METSSSLRRSVRKQKRGLIRNRFDLRTYTRELKSNENLRDPRTSMLLFYCGQENCDYVNGVSSNFKKHLRTKHKIEVLPLKPLVLQAAERTMQQLNNHDSMADLSQAIDLTEDILTLAVINLVVRHSLPLSTVEWPSFHGLLTLINPRSAELLTMSRRTLTSDIKVFWERKKALIKAELQHARSNINISLDI